MTLLTLLMHRDGLPSGDCTWTYAPDDGSTYSPDSAYTYAPDSAFTYAPTDGATYDPCAD